VEQTKQEVQLKLLAVLVDRVIFPAAGEVGKSSWSVNPELCIIALLLLGQADTDIDIET